jgi:DNA helicase-2/ATP-dependent DNA helicase PcrA
MNLVGARVHGKPQLAPGSTINGNYPPVAIHREHSAVDVAEFLAKTLRGLKDSDIIRDYSECVLLLPSTRRSAANAGPFMDAMDRAGIPYYNPRSRGILEEEEIQAILGGLLEIIDPESVAQRTVKYQSIKEKCDEWREQFNIIAGANHGLREYVDNYADSIMRMGPRTSVGVNLLEIFYDLLNFPPFSTWIDDQEISLKLGIVCKVLDSYSNVPSSRNPNTMLGFLYTSAKANAGISFNWRRNFYYSLLGLLASEGLNDAEDEIENFPRGKVPIMTIHQSKGLEFPVVFVYGLSKNNNDSASVYLESAFAQFRRQGLPHANSFSPGQRMRQDMIRLFFVAYSRAQYALILLARQSEYTKPGIGFGGSSRWTVFGNAIEI